MRHIKNKDDIIVLGAQVREDGPSVVLKYRLDTAIDYLNENPDTLCIVSGGQGINEPFSEAEGMSDYLMKNVAEALKIELHQTECTYEGECSGTCPKCRQEEQKLNRALLSRTAVAAGMAALSFGLAACGSVEELEGEPLELTPTPEYGQEALVGEVPYEELEEDELWEGEAPIDESMQEE